MDSISENIIHTCVCVHVFYNKDDSDFKVNISEEKREFLEF